MKEFIRKQQGSDEKTKHDVTLPYRIDRNDKEEGKTELVWIHGGYATHTRDWYVTYGIDSLYCMYLSTLPSSVALPVFAVDRDTMLKCLGNCGIGYQGGWATAGSVWW